MPKHDVFTNGRSNIHKGSGDKAVFGPPDVCKTPIGSAIVPIPYPNISQSSTLKKGSKSVKINGKPACLKGSTFESSNGDQAGRVGGIFSSVTGKETEFVTSSFDTKIEGRNVVRHMDATTHNKKNTMGAVYGSASIGGPFDDAEGKKYKCIWKNCKGQHTHKVDYDNKGCTVRSEYTGIWQDPWSRGPGKTSSKITLSHYKNENKVKHQVAAAALFGTPQYATENHHLIPIKEMSKYKNLAHNAKLLNFDINDGKYGICLPYFITDIFRHDLQSHKTSHPGYSKRVGRLLRRIELESLKYCSNNNQQQRLINDLEDLSEDLREFIISWDEIWLLRRDAIEDRVKSYDRAGFPHP